MSKYRPIQYINKEELLKKISEFCTSLYKVSRGNAVLVSSGSQAGMKALAYRIRLELNCADE